MNSSLEGDQRGGCSALKQNRLIEGFWGSGYRFNWCGVTEGREMAIQAQLYPGNNVGVGLPPWGSSQGYGVAANHNGCGYDYGFSGMKQREQQQLQLELFLQQQLQNHDQRSNGNWCFDNTSLVTAPEDGAYKNNHLSINDMVQAAAPIAAAAASSSSSYSQSVPFQLDPHGQEIDHLLRLQVSHIPDPTRHHMISYILPNM